jgi:opacity protein-like surface antigen
MKKLLLGAAMALALMSPAWAKNLAIPTDDPVVTLTIPNTWTMKEIDFGYSAVSPEKDVVFYVEYAAGKRVKAMTDLNKEWLKENSIKTIGEPQELDLDFNGVKGSVLKFKAKDDNGPTNVNFAFIPAGKERVIMLTIWGSDEEQAKHGKDIDSILGSIKPIN